MSDHHASPASTPASAQSSPFGPRKAFSPSSVKKWERKTSSNDALNNDAEPVEDFRKMARKLSRSGGTQNMLDSAARLAALKKLEAEEKLRLQQQIEDMKNGMNSVETVVKDGFTYDPSKVRQQIEEEEKEAEESIKDIVIPEEVESEEYKKWLEEIMSQGWSVEVKELIEAKKKVSKRNLIRARRRTIVRRYTLVVPDLEQPNITEDEMSEQEKMRTEIEYLFQMIDLEYSIEELSNNKEWALELQELICAKKKINKHNLRNARKRNVVKRARQKFPYCFHELELEVDEFNDDEWARMTLDREIEELNIELDKGLDVAIKCYSKIWGLDISGELDAEKKLKSRRNVFNLLVRKMVEREMAKVPELSYPVELEEDEWTEEERGRREQVRVEEEKRVRFEREMREVEERLEGLMMTEEGCWLGDEEVMKGNEMVIEGLRKGGKKLTKYNIIKALKKEVVLIYYGKEALEEHSLTDKFFEFTDAFIASKYIEEEMAAVDKKLALGDLETNFPDEVADLTTARAEINPGNIRMMKHLKVTESALTMFPGSGLTVSPPAYELNKEGKDYLKLCEELKGLDEIDVNDDKEFFKDERWEKERGYLSENKMKETSHNVINVRKRELLDQFRSLYPSSDVTVDDEVFDKYTEAELAQIAEAERQQRVNDVTKRVRDEIEDARMIIIGAFKLSEISCEQMTNHLDEEIWGSEIEGFTTSDMKCNRRNLFRAKCKTIIEQHQRLHPELRLVLDDMKSVGDLPDDEIDDEEDLISLSSGGTEAEGGCATCEIRTGDTFSYRDSIVSEMSLDSLISEEAERVDDVTNDAIDKVLDHAIGLAHDLKPHSERPAILTSEGFNVTSDDEYDEDTLGVTPGGDVLPITPGGDILPSPFPGHGYNSPGKLFDSKMSTSSESGPSFGMKRASIPEESEDKVKLSEQYSTESAFSQLSQQISNDFNNSSTEGFVNSSEFEESVTGHTEEILPTTLKSASMGSDSVFSEPAEEGKDNEVNTDVEHVDDGENDVGVEEDGICDVDGEADRDCDDDGLGASVVELIGETRFGVEDSSDEMEGLDEVEEVDEIESVKKDVKDADPAHESGIGESDGEKSNNAEEVNPASGGETPLDHPTDPLKLGLDLSGGDADCEMSPMETRSRKKEYRQRSPSSADDREELRTSSPETEPFPKRDTKRKKEKDQLRVKDPIIKRQEDYLQRSQKLNRAQSKDSLSNSRHSSPANKYKPKIKKSPANGTSPVTPKTGIPKVFKRAQSMTDVTKKVRGNKKRLDREMLEREAYEREKIERFKNIKSQYKSKPLEPHLDRTKFKKVPTLSDNNVTSEAILEGLLPKEFYKNILSFDMSPTPERKQRSASLVDPNQATTGHMLWEAIKQKKLDRLEENEKDVDLDTAVSERMTS